MRYIQSILLPDERILYNGRVHWVVYAPGVLLCLSSLAVAGYLSYLEFYVNLGGAPALPYRWGLPYLAEANFALAEAWRSLRGALPSAAYVSLVLSWSLFFWGSYKTVKAYVLSHYTELVVTDRRVIAKYGFTNITTMEIDRFKIAGVTIQQSALGRVLNYGKINLRGFSGYIAGLPVIGNPHELQRQVNRR